MNKQNLPKWLSSQVLRSAPGEVDEQHSTIKGALIVSAGEATGHGIFLDDDFVRTVIEKGNARAAGIKARFGHPNMCSSALGTFLGRWKNFSEDTVTREDGTKALAARGDLFLSNSASESPQGDLKAYVLSLATDSPDMFGNSIVMSPGDVYKKTSDGEKVYSINGHYEYESGDWLDQAEIEKLSEQTFVTCDALHACDVVDQPAANDSMFSKFSTETIAGQVTEFLDLNPDVFKAFSENEEVLAALKAYPTEIAAFIERYSKYSTKTATGAVAKQEDNKMSIDPKKVEPVVEPGAGLSAKPVEPVVEPVIEPVVEPLSKVTKPVEPKEPTEREEFSRMVEAFGSDIASEVFAAGGSYEDAQDKHLEAMKQENETLKKKVTELESATGGDPAKFSEPAPPKKSFADVVLTKKK